MKTLQKNGMNSVTGGNFGAFRTTNKHFFNNQHPIFLELSKIIKIRKEHLALRQGRVYQRDISYNGKEFELPHKLGDDRHTGVIVWSRILSDEEIVLAINCDLEQDRSVEASIDSTLHQVDNKFECIYSSHPSQAGSTVRVGDVMGKIVIPLTVPQCGCVVYRKKDK
jgi:hypothetical protein